MSGLARAVSHCEMWFFAGIFALASALGLLIHYADRSIKPNVLALVGLSWGLAFSYFFLLPFDIEHTLCRMCMEATEDVNPFCRCLPSPGIGILETLIPIVYWITMLLGYVMNDMVREFMNSGEFSSRGRVKDALHAAVYFYVPAMIIGLCFVFYLMSTKGADFTDVRLIGRGMMNAIGLFILIAFLGYGLVEVPRQLWNKGNPEGQLRYTKFKVASQSEALQNARRRLEETLELVQETEVQLCSETGTSTLLKVWWVSVVEVVDAMVARLI